MASLITQIKDNDNVKHNIVASGIIRATKDSVNSTANLFKLTTDVPLELQDGIMIFFRNDGTASAKPSGGNFKIQVNNLTPKTVWCGYLNTEITSHIATYKEYILYFDAINDRWVYYEGRDTNANTIGEYAGQRIVGPNGWLKGQIGLPVSETEIEGPCLSRSASVYTKSKNPHGFLLTRSMIFQGIADYVEGDIVPTSSTWVCYGTGWDLRYNTNITTTWSAAGRPFYLKGTINPIDGKFYLADTTWWADALPNTSDGYYYWYVGQMNSAYTCIFMPYHPIYYHDGEKICEYIVDSELDYKSNVSGDIVTLRNSTDDNLKDCIVHIESQQEGEGDPSPENIRNITGWVEADINVTKRCVLGGEDFASTFGTCNGYSIDKVNKVFTMTKAGICFKKYSPIFKENTQYSFVFTYTSTGANNCFYIDYTDGTSSTAQNLPAKTSKGTTIITSTGGKTISKYGMGSRTANTVTCYYEESGIYEGVVTENDLEEYERKQTSIELVSPDSIDFTDYLNSSAQGLTIDSEGDLIIISGTPNASYSNLTEQLNYSIAANTLVTLKTSNAHAYRIVLRMWDTSSGTTDIILEPGECQASKFVTKQINKIRLFISGLSTSINYNDSFNAKLFTDIIYGGDLNVRTGEMKYNIAGQYIDKTYLKNITSDYISFDTTNNQISIRNFVYSSTDGNVSYCCRDKRAGGYYCRSNVFSVLYFNDTNLNSSQYRLFIKMPSGVTNYASWQTYIQNLIDNNINVFFEYEFTHLSDYTTEAPITVQLSPNEIETFIGNNSISVNCGMMDISAINNTKVVKAINELVNNPEESFITPANVSTNEIVLMAESENGDAKVMTSKGLLNGLILKVDSLTGNMKVGKGLRKWTKFDEVTGATLATTGSINVPYNPYLNPNNPNSASEIMVKLEIQITPEYKAEEQWILPIDQLLLDNQSPTMYQDKTLLTGGFYYSSSYYATYGVEYSRTSNKETNGVTFSFSTGWAKVQGQGSITSNAYRLGIYYR